MDLLYFDQENFLEDYRSLIEFRIRRKRLNNQSNLCDGKIIEFNFKEKYSL